MIAVGLGVDATGQIAMRDVLSNGMWRRLSYASNGWCLTVACFSHFVLFDEFTNFWFANVVQVARGARGR